MARSKAFKVEAYPARILGIGRKQWRFRAVSRRNGERMAWGESYNNRGDLEDTVEELFDVYPDEIEWVAR